MSRSRTNEQEKTAGAPLKERILWGTAGVLLLLILGVLLALVPYVFVHDFLVPLVNGGPVLRLHSVTFALPGLVLGFGSVVLLAVGVVAHPRHMRSSTFDRIQTRAVVGMLVALVLLVPVPLIASIAAAAYVDSRGYDYCSRLSRSSLRNHESVFVIAPRLCVPGQYLDDAVRRYEGYLPGQVGRR